MKRSKIIFGAIAAVVAVFVLIVLLIIGANPDRPENPSGTTGPEGPGTTAGNEDPTTGGDEPTTGGEVEDPTLDTLPPEIILPSTPENPYVGANKYGYITGETAASKMPDSIGTYYNGGVSSLSVPNTKNSSEIYTFTFGFQQANNPALSITDYLCLNPTVTYGGKLTTEIDFYFHFIPSSGYVTTFSSRTPGESYSQGKGCHSYTFNRAMDYVLPAEYVSETVKGTVWYNDTPMDGSTEWLDILIYKNKNIFTTLRLYLVKAQEGWAIGNLVCTDLHMLDKSTEAFAAGDLRELSQEHIDGLVAQTKENLQKWHGSRRDMSGLTYDDFVIDFRAAGKGTYFSHASSSVTTALSLIDTAQYKDLELWAVSFRNAQIANNGPLTYYYCIQEGAGADGEDLYELVAIDYIEQYRLGHLLVAQYPGYFYAEEDYK